MTADFYDYPSTERAIYDLSEEIRLDREITVDVAFFADYLADAKTAIEKALADEYDAEEIQALEKCLADVTRFLRRFDDLAQKIKNPNA